MQWLCSNHEFVSCFSNFSSIHTDETLLYIPAETVAKEGMSPNPVDSVMLLYSMLGKNCTCKKRFLLNRVINIRQWYI